MRNLRAKPGSKRQAILRQRRRDGIVIAPVPVGIDAVETLIDLRWLRVAESEDRRQIGEAIGAMLADLARGQRK